MPINTNGMPTDETNVVTDVAFAALFVALIEELLKLEGRPLAGHAEALADGQDAEVIEHVNMHKAMTDRIKAEINALMATRLAANDRRVVLLQASDTDRIILKIFAGNTMSEEVMTVMATIRPIVSLSIEGTITFLNAIDLDLYSAFWQFVAALSSEAAESGQTFMRVVASAEFRAGVYRRCMSLTKWRKLTAARCALVAGISLSTLMGGMKDSMNDSTGADFDAALDTMQAAINPGMANMVAQMKKFYADLGREIWPANSRS